MKKQTDAAKVIQKWQRGAQARKAVSRLRARRQGAIDAEYGYYNSQVKFAKDYNLEKFTRDRKRLRELNKDVGESDSIQERIGESSSLNSRVPVMSKNAAGQSLSQS